MKRALRVIGKVLLVVLVLVVVVVAIALTPVSIPETSHTVPPLSEIRALAASSGQPLPVEIRALKVVDMTLPRLVVMAGQGPGTQEMVGYTYQVVYADGRTEIIDAVPGPKAAQALGPGPRVNEDAYARQEEAMRKAEHIVITHEHFDHASGISDSPFLAEIAPKVAMTPEQLHGKAADQAGFTPEIVQRLTPLKYDRLHLLSPGVVLVKAPGHTPGSQMVYVRLADNREYLFVGDIAWNMSNIRVPRTSPRAVTWVMPEDGPAIADQLRYLHGVLEKEPNVHLVVAHDPVLLDEYLRSGVLGAGLK